MSLDVYLEIPGAALAHTGSGIFVRQNGQTLEISREEWDRLHPGQEPVVAPGKPETDEVFHANITHNLRRMADEAGLYEAMWRPEEIQITKARQLIEPLAAGLCRLLEDPERFKALNPENGWGSYDGLVRFVSDYLTACIENPHANVMTWR